MPSPPSSAHSESFCAERSKRSATNWWHLLREWSGWQNLLLEASNVLGGAAAGLSPKVLGGQAASTPLGLTKCCIGAGEHQAIAALMIAHARGRDTTTTLFKQMSQCFFWVGVCVCCIKLGRSTPQHSWIWTWRVILGSFVARCHLSSVQLGPGCALLTASGS